MIRDKIFDLILHIMIVLLELHKKLGKLITEFSSMKKTVERNMDIITTKLTKVEKEIASLRLQLSVISSSLRSSLGIPFGSNTQFSAKEGLRTTKKISNSLDQSEKTYNSIPLLSDSLMDITKMDIDMIDTSTANLQPGIPSALQTTTQTVNPVPESPHVEVHQSVAISTPHEGEIVYQVHNSKFYLFILL